jgi:predicted O-linked N-acetylglucosamine transferase (SPINDLY family)
MDKTNWAESKEQREKEAVEEHERLRKLFKENRFAFELERKRAIEKVINGARTEQEKEKLWALQAGWDNRLKNAGTKDNRFIMAQTMFWDHFNNVWTPAIQELNTALNGNKDQE